MAYSLVGSAGAVTIGTSGGAVTPAWDAGASRTANNLLLCLVAGWGNGTIPGLPAGWTNAQNGASGPAAAIFYKVAAGSDAAPTIAAVTGMTWGVQLLEFSGNVTTGLLDNTGNAGTGASPASLATSGTDSATGELVVWVAAEGSVVLTATMSSSVNNGMVANDVQNNSTSTATHYLLGWGIPTTNSVADTNSVTFNAGSGDALQGAIASFKAIPLPVQSNLRARL